MTVIYSLGSSLTHTHTYTHTHTHTHTHAHTNVPTSWTKAVSINQVRASLWLVCTWFKNSFKHMNYINILYKVYVVI